MNLDDLDDYNRFGPHPVNDQAYGYGNGPDYESLSLNTEAPSYIDDDWSVAESNDCLAKGSITLFADIDFDLDQEMLIDNVLPQTGITMLFAPSGMGKTFVALDLALSIARGVPFAGMHETKQGHVLVLALEAPRGVCKRIGALREHFNISEAPFGLVDYPLDLCDPRSVTGIIDLIRQYMSEHNSEVALLIIDTLNRAMPGRDENGPKDAGAAIAGLQRIQRATGRCILVVHHPGKDEGRGARGHSSIFAAMDAVLAIEGEKSDPVRRLLVKKLKDGIDGIHVCSYRLQQVSLGIDSRHREVTSAIANWCQGEKAKRRAMPTGAQQALLNHLDQLVINGEFQVFPNRDGVPANAKCVASDRLLDRAIRGGDVAITDERRNARTSIRTQIRKLQSDGIVHQFDGFVWRINER